MLDPAKPCVYGDGPMAVSLEPGEYYYCRCGRSKTQPFCDGAHGGTAFTPLAFTVDTPQRMAMCLCKYTQREPRCDGSHNRLPADIQYTPD